MSTEGNVNGGLGLIVMGVLIVIPAGLQLLTAALSYRPGEFDALEPWEQKIPSWASMIGVRTRAERGAQDRLSAQIAASFGALLIAVGCVLLATR